MTSLYWIRAQTNKGRNELKNSLELFGPSAEGPLVTGPRDWIVFAYVSVGLDETAKKIDVTV